MNNIYYTYDLNVEENLVKYFALKEKHNKKITDIEKETIMLDIYNDIDSLDKYDVIIYPESSKKLLEQVVDLFVDIEKIKLIKRDKKEILESVIRNNKMSKQEKESQRLRFDKMDGFQINKIKSNQREKYIPYVFQDLKVKELSNKKILIVDDSIFTLNTIKAIESVITLSEIDVYVPFYQKNDIIKKFLSD